MKLSFPILSTRRHLSGGKRLICYIILTVCSAGAQTFNLLIPPDKNPLLQARAVSKEFQIAWSNYLAGAYRLCDPLSGDYADPDEVTAGYDLQGHIVARRLIQWMETLGMAYRLTGDPKYRDHGISLLLNSAREITLDSVYMSQSAAGARGDLMRAFATGYDCFASELTVPQRTQILQTSKAYVDDFINRANAGVWWRPHHNYQGVCGGAAGMAALQLRDIDPISAKAALQQVISLTKEWLANGFDEQGASYEGVLYSVYGLENVVLFADILKQTGGEDLFEHPALQNVINYYIHSLLPGEKSLDARNDSLYDRNPGNILLKFSTEYDDGAAAWLYEPVSHVSRYNTGQGFFLRLLWSAEKTPVRPNPATFPLAEYFQGRGLCSWRTGWTSDDVMFSIEAGKFYPVTHNQADKGHFTLYSHGYRWACDPGYANSQDPEGRGQTIAHNNVLIDGIGQAVSGAGRGSNGKILAYTNTFAYGYALADCTSAYRSNNVSQHMSMNHAYRHTLFIRETSMTPAYAVVLDDIDKDGASHEYRWQMLSWPDLQIEAGEKSAVISPLKDNPTAVKTMVFLDAESDLTVAANLCTPIDINKPNLTPTDFPRLNATCTAVNPYFAAVLIPVAGAVSPEVRFETSSGVKTILVEWPGQIDRIVWNTGSSVPETAVRFFMPGFDDFNRDDSVMSHSLSVGPEWVSSKASAKWRVKDQRVIAETSESHSVLYNKSLQTISGNGTRFTASLDVTALQSNVWGGLAFNVQDADNFYYFRYKGGANNYALVRMVNGSSAHMVNMTIGRIFALDTDYTLTVSSSNAYTFSYQIKETLSGTVMASGIATDDDSTFTGGYAGLLQSTIGSGRFRFDNFSAGLSKLVAIQRPGTDDFNRANTSMSYDGSVIGDDWQNSRSDAKWGLADGRLTTHVTGDAAVLYNTAVETISGDGTHFTVSLDVMALDTLWAGIVFNYQDADNFYYFRYKGGANNYFLDRMVEGAVTAVTRSTIDGTFALDTNYTLTVSSSEAYTFDYEVKETLSGTVLVSGTVTDSNSTFIGGYAGILQSSRGIRAGFDNFFAVCETTPRSGFFFMLTGRH